FLKEHGSEVHNMLLSGWNWDDAKRVWQREAMEDALDKRDNEILDLIKKGYTAADIENYLLKQTRTATA
ncbi:MAG: hypothetical protein FWF63_05780, partial [Fibromonadales bacterium]|nr:hypothetical protein [Fibromonadales bacterium]